MQDACRSAFDHIEPFHEQRHQQFVRPAGVEIISDELAFKRLLQPALELSVASTAALKLGRVVTLPLRFGETVVAASLWPDPVSASAPLKLRVTEVPGMLAPSDAPTEIWASPFTSVTVVKWSG
jgi:hypothetical protein